MTWSFDGAAGTCSGALCHVCICGVGGVGRGGEREEAPALCNARSSPCYTKS